VAGAQVMRELSDKVVEWQESHKEISGELVAQKLRAAQLQTEHDNLRHMIKDLMAKQAQMQAEGWAPAAPAAEKSRSLPRAPKKGKEEREGPSSRVKQGSGTKLGGAGVSRPPQVRGSGPTSKGRIGFLGRLKTPRNRD
jgi:septal ring factor EnvC (AmiA/AmiB activator)